MARRSRKNQTGNNDALSEVCIDFAQFNSEPSDLDLVVGAPHALHRTVVKEAPEVPRAIHAVHGVAGEGVHKEFGRGRVGKFEVPDSS